MYSKKTLIELIKSTKESNMKWQELMFQLSYPNKNILNYIFLDLKNNKYTILSSKKYQVKMLKFLLIPMLLTGILQELLPPFKLLVHVILLMLLPQLELLLVSRKQQMEEFYLLILLNKLFPVIQTREDVKEDFNYTLIYIL